MSRNTVTSRNSREFKMFATDVSHLEFSKERNNFFLSRNTNVSPNTIMLHSS